MKHYDQKKELEKKNKIYQYCLFGFSFVVQTTKDILWIIKKKKKKSIF